MSSLYAVKPLMPDIDPVLPSSDVFYKVAPFFPAGNLGAHGSAASLASKSNALGALEHQQLSLLQRLEDLKKQVLALAAANTAGGSAGAGAGAVCCGGAGSSNSSSNGSAVLTKAPAPGPSFNKPFTPTKNDVVVQTSTASPALISLAAAYLLEDQGANLAVRHFWHSSNPKPVPAGFVAAHRGEGSGNVDTRVSFSWGNTSPPRAFLHGTNVSGDCNLAKFLCRLHNSSLLLEHDPLLSTQVDNWLWCVTGGCKPPAIAAALDSALAKSPYLLGASPTLADIAAWAAMRTSGLGSPAVKAWLQRVGNEPFARRAVAALPQ